MRDLTRFGPGDALIGLSLLALVFAALLPAYRARAFDHRVDAAAADVEALRESALRLHGASGRWPAAGAVPPGARGVVGGDTTLVHEGYALEWATWERVERVPAPPRAPAPPPPEDDEAPPPVGQSAGDAPPDSVGPQTMSVVTEQGAVMVHSGDDALLRELLGRYGSEVSWIRDTIWTLVVTAEEADRSP